MRALLYIALAVVLGSCTAAGSRNQAGKELITVTVIGTNDVHGSLLPAQFSGGLTTLSGYVAALRAVREQDGGAVLLVDAGDMWQGTLESNLVEGASVVQAYNALGYAAATIGNHEFDFGPAGSLAIPQSASDDPQGALRQRAREMRFPLLAANIIDTSTGRPVDWENVRPAMMTEAAGIKVGIIGVVTSRALQTTIAANTTGLAIGSLSDAIVREARVLRADGASIVLVAAHAGAQCTGFGDPLDLSSCDDGEIVRVARSLPAGLVDHIIAGHVHQGMAHVVNGIVITSSYAKTYAFSRVDFSIDAVTHDVVGRKIFPPQVNCPRIDTATNDCAWLSHDARTTRPVLYEKQAVRAMPAIVAIAEMARAHAAEIKSEPLGVTLETPFTLDGNPESPLANLFTDALYDQLGADIVVHNVTGGIRSTLRAGELTYGDVFNVFPFDNRTVILDLSGAELRRVIAHEAHKTRRRAGFAGMRVFVRCDSDAMQVELILDDGRIVLDSDRVRIAVNDFLATGGDDILTPAIPDGGFRYADDPRMTRELLADWFRRRGGTMHASEFDSGAAPRWNLPDSLPASCRLP